MGRSLFAITVGMACIAGLSVLTDLALMTALPSLHDARGATDSTTVLLLTIAYVALYTTAGAYATARLAPSRPRRHAVAVGVCTLVFLAAGSITRWDLAPLWYHVVAAALAVPCAWAGGQWRARELAYRQRSRMTRVPVA